jgi:hypothetical protein
MDTKTPVPEPASIPDARYSTTTGELGVLLRDVLRSVSREASRTPDLSPAAQAAVQRFLAISADLSVFPPPLGTGAAQPRG